MPTYSGLSLPTGRSVTIISRNSSSVPASVGPMDIPLTIEGSAPALVDAVAQSSVFNPAQRKFLRAAKLDWHSAELQDKDQRNAMIQDVALTYAELAKWEVRLARLQQDETQAQQMEQAVAARLQEGVDSAVDLNKAKLTMARVRLHQIEARGSADVLRRHLATLTGLSASSIEVEPETIPALPPIATPEDLSEKAITSSPAIKLADQHSLAEAMRASGEHRSSLPSIDFSAQYARLSTFNNYSQYLRHHFKRTMPPSDSLFAFPYSTPASAPEPTPQKQKPSRQRNKPKPRAIR